MMHTGEPEPLTHRCAVPPLPACGERVLTARPSPEAWAPSPRLRGEGRGEGPGDASDINIMRLAFTEQY